VKGCCGERVEVTRATGAKTGLFPLCERIGLELASRYGAGVAACWKIINEKSPPRRQSNSGEPTAEHDATVDRAERGTTIVTGVSRILCYSGEIRENVPQAARCVAATQPDWTRFTSPRCGPATIGRVPIQPQSDRAGMNRAPRGLACLRKRIAGWGVNRHQESIETLLWTAPRGTLLFGSTLGVTTVLKGRKRLVRSAGEASPLR